MSRAPRRLMPPTAGRTSVENFEVEEFSRRLNKLMLDKGMKQSDLARQVWGTQTDKRGYEVARNRDRISVYLSGRGYPDPVNLAKIADALGTTPEDLAPNITAATVEREKPEILMSAISGHSDKVLLRVNKLVPLSVAAEIVGILSRGA